MVTMINDRKPRRPFGGVRPIFFQPGKKGFELQFHWIFILIAGALILAFFFSVANKQRVLSQEKLQLTLATDIENIFTGAIVSRGTAQKLPVPPQGIAFECTEGCQCQFRIERAPRDFGDKAMFAPALLKDQDIVVWALELKMPYRVTNFLYLTNPNIKYYFVYSDEPTSNSLRRQLTKNIPPLISYENITQQEMASIKYEEYQHTKFILLNVEPTDLDPSFKKSSFSAVKIDQNGVGFYEKDITLTGRNSLKRLKYLSYVGLPSLYAAIFAEDSTMYECGLKTAFRKLSYVSQIYAERASVLQEQAFAADKVWCAYGAPSSTNLCENQNPATVIGMLCQQHKLGKELSANLDQTKILQLSPLLEQLDSQNRNFLQQSCPELF